MKKLVLSLLIIISISSAGFAASYESSDTENSPEDKGFYVGIAYSHLSHDLDFAGLGEENELDFNALMIDIGYKFNPYVALDARYNISFGDEQNIEHHDEIIDGKISVLSFFVKPMYPIAPEMDFYLLLGYSLIDANYPYNTTFSVDEGSFSWGAGASYDMTEDFSVFAEYAQFYNDTLNGFDHVIDSFNIGITYKF
jgi:opacity protein-like surface antigen